ncbi:hypothetical protein J0H33_03710 [bacterium]|nr:hypothetical protein [bacterium]
MAATRGSVTAHVKRVRQDEQDVTTLVMSEAQLLELAAVINSALREKAAHEDGYHLAIWKDRPVAKCQASPPCEGGAAGVYLVRQAKRRNTKMDKST